MGEQNVLLGGKRAIARMLTEAVVVFWLVTVLLVLQPRLSWGFDVFGATRASMVLSQRISTRVFSATVIATEIGIEDGLTNGVNPNNNGTKKSSCYAFDDDGSDGDNQETSLLLCPSSHPSKTFVAPNLEVSYQPIMSDGTHGNSFVQLLPLQKYHARAQKRRKRRRRRRKHSGEESDHEKHFHHDDRNTNDADIDLLLGKSNIVQHDIPSLDFIYKHRSRFVITKSSQVLLEEYHNHKQSCMEGNNNTNTNPSNKDPQLELLELLEGRLRSKIRAECRASLPLDIEKTLQILYCDSHICVVNKPSGVLSVPGHKRNPSLADLVYDTIQPSSTTGHDDGSIDNIDQSVVHRLDMATSGIIVYALSKQALQELHITFRDRKVQKTYQALVEGHLDAGAMEGEIDVALERDPENPPYMRIAQSRPEEPPTEKNESGDAKNNVNDKSSQEVQSRRQHKLFRVAPKPSKTTWSILSYERDASGKPLTRVALTPHTGRTHQLRVHTSSVLGAPIVGDDIYGSGNHDPNQNLCLHAHRLCIHHPITGAPMVFEADPPF